MYPELYSFSLGDATIPVTTFGVLLTISFFLFFWMLKRLGRRYEISTAFFSANLLSFFLVTFFTSRLAHVILYAGLPTKSAFSLDYPFLSFFLMSDFYFSLGGAILGFFGLLWFYIRRREQKDREEILDITVISWMFASIVGYFGSFLGGQVYGVRSESSMLSVDYINNPVLAEYPRFPLALAYVIVVLVIFSLIYIVKKLRPERGLAAGLGALLWGIMWFIGEWWNDASSDNIASIFGLLRHWKIVNFNQILSLCFIAWGLWKLAQIIPSPLSEWIINVGDKVSDVVEDIADDVEDMTQKYYKKIKKYIIFVAKKIKK